MTTGADAAGRERPRPEPVGLALVASVGVVALSAAMLAPAFMTNDDPMLSLIAAGRLVTSTPDEHLLYTNVTIGLLLRGLYAAAPAWPWYSIHLLLALVTASTLTLGLGLRGRPPTAVRSLVWVVGLGLLGRFVLELQFTVVATWLAWAAAAWVVAARVAPRSGSGGAVGVAVLGLGWAGLIRPEGATLGWLLAVPLLAWLHAAVGWRRAWPATASLLVGLAVIWSLAAANRVYYARGSWAEFYALNTAKQIITDNDLVREGAETDAALREVGWSVNDLEMMRRWFFVDEEVYSLANIGHVSRASTRRSMRERLVRAVDQVGVIRRDPLAEVWVGLLVLLVLTARAPVVVWGLAVSGWGATLVLALSVAARPIPSRVYLPCLAAVIGGLLFLAGTQPLRRLTRRTAAVLLLLLVFPALVGVRRLSAAQALHRTRVEAFAEDWTRLRAREPRLVVAWGPALPYDLLVRPLREPRPAVDEPSVVSLGFLARTPLTRAVLDAADVDELPLGLVDDAGLVLIALAADVPVLRRYFVEHHGRVVDVLPVLRGDTFTAWRLVSRSGPARPSGDGRTGA